MPGGRPSRSGHDGYPELAELAAWFKAAITACGYSSVNAFVQQHTLDKNKVYEVARGTGLLSLESTKGLARLLKRDPAEAEPIWVRAREAMDLRLMADDDDHAPRVTSWAEIPRPELALRNVLDALAHVTEQLPYRLLGINPPPLSTVYVRQRLRESSPTGGGEAPKERDRPEGRPHGSEQSSTDIPVTVAEALNRSDHLLITGEPGAGKSTLGHQLISRLAKIWLRRESATNPPLNEPVVPLRVSARSLVGAGAWSTVLAEATRRALGPYLVTEPSHHLFTGRTQGVRWLIVVDGLDEILDRPTRTSIIRAIGQHARTNGDYRFVITSRPLPDEELAPLQIANIGVCRIEPFEPEELKLFSERWFLSQDPITAECRAEQFLEQVSDGRLKDLVRNPLLASIAAVVNTLEPDRPLPANRIDLYQRFYEYLVTDEEASGRATPSELRRLEQSHPARYRLAEWMHSQRITIIDVIAKERLTTDTLLTETACDWVRRNKPTGMTLPPGWEADADRLLIDTGMLVYESSGLRFLHHTFAEFLAARTFAQTIPSDFPEKEEWFKRGLIEAERNFVLLTFALWAKVPGNDVGIILRSLLGGGYARILLAGRLVAELGGTNDLSTRSAVDRLIDLALGNALDGGEDHNFAPNPRTTRIADVLSRAERAFDVIGLLQGNAYASRKLRNIIEKTEIPFVTRILALDAFHRVTSGEETLKRLKSISDESDQPFNRIICALGFIEFGPSELNGEMCRELVALKDHPQINAESRMLIADALAEQGDTASATDLSWSVLSEAGAASPDIRSAVKLLLSQGHDDPIPHLGRIIGLLSTQRPEARAAAAREMVTSGNSEHAKILARDIVDDMDAGSTPLTQAVEILLQDAPEDDTKRLLELLSKRPDWVTERADLLDTLLDAGHINFVINEATSIIKTPNSRPYSIGQAVSAWLTATEATSVDTLMHALRERPQLNAWTRAVTSRALADAGLLPEAAEIAYPIFLDPSADAYDLGKAARVALLPEAPDVEDILRTVKERAACNINERARMVEVLSALERSEEILTPALQVLSDSTIIKPTFTSVVNSLISATGVSKADKVAECMMRQGNLTYRFIAADILARAGALQAAVSIWRNLLTLDALSTIDAFTVLNRLINTGHRQEAIESLQSEIENGSRNKYNIGRIRRLLAWAALSDIDEAQSASPE
ncbi:NACHT domain-containing protein [Streptomyces sp. NPDC002787]